MQTFVPHGPLFSETARTLDMKRLGKQRVEVYQIIRALTGEQKGWRHHPAVKMWDGYELALTLYGIVMCDEWVKRGYKDSLKPKLTMYLKKFMDDQQTVDFPRWLWDSDVIKSHRSNLIRKYADHYGPMWPDTPNDLPYVWPVA